MKTDCVLGNSDSNCLIPSVSSDKRKATALQFYAPKLPIPQLECTENSHCATDPNKAKCNLDPAITTRTGYPQNTCIDSVKPTSTISFTPSGCDAGTNGIRESTAGQSCSGDDRPWFKAGVYIFSVVDSDNVGGSGIDAAYRPVTIRSKGLDDVWGTTASPGDDRVYPLVRNTANKFNVWVGPRESLANDCVDQREERCRIEVYARDLVGNEIKKEYPLNIDYTPPTAQ